MKKVIRLSSIISYKTKEINEKLNTNLTPIDISYIWKVLIEEAFNRVTLQNNVYLTHFGTLDMNKFKLNKSRTAVNIVTKKKYTYDTYHRLNVRVSQYVKKRLFMRIKKLKNNTGDTE